MKPNDFRGPRLAAAAIVLAAAVLAGCGGADSPPAPAPVAPPVTAAPAPAPTPQAFRCPLPDMPRLNIQCPRPGPLLFQQVDSAINTVVAQHPQLFNLSDDKGGGSYLVLDRAAYHEEVVKALHAQNVCAIVELEEIAVKVSNDYNEQYNIWISDGHIRHGPRSYITTCYPATF